MPHKEFLDDEVLEAIDVNDYLMAQSVMGFASLAARAAALAGVEEEGMHTYLADSDVREFFDGTRWVDLTPQGALVATEQTTTSTTYADLATAGPAVTLKTGAAVLVIVSAYMEHSVQHQQCFMSFAVSGATTLAADDTRSAMFQIYSATAKSQLSAMFYYPSLTPGVNVFTSKYRMATPLGGTAKFRNRSIAVIPLP